MATSTSETPISSIPFTRDKVLLDASEIRELCPQFRILVIGKANAGKTTLLRKVCLASADVEPTIRDKEGNVIDLDGANEIVSHTDLSLVYPNRSDSDDLICVSP